MPDNQSQAKPQWLTRRRLMQMMATSGAGSLVAGCAGGGGGEETTTGGGQETTAGGGQDTESPEKKEGKQWVDQLFRFRVRNPVDEENYNPWSSSGADTHAAFMAWGPLYAHTHDTNVPMTAKGFTYDGNKGEIRMTIREDAVWNNGDPITAEDAVLKQELNRAMTPKENRPEVPLFTSWRAEGSNKKTFVAKLNPKGVNERTAQWDYTDPYGGIMFDIHRGSVFADKLEAIKDATTTKKKDEIRKSVTEIKRKLPDVNMSGPWMPKSATKQQAEFELNPEHFAYKRPNSFNFKQLRLKFISNSNTRQAVFGNDEIDTQHGMPPSTPLPEGHQLLFDVRVSHHSMSFNHKPPQKKKFKFLRNPKVRQAIAYVLDRTEITRAQKYGAEGTSIDVPSGAKDFIAKEAIPDLYPKLRTYGKQTKDKHLQKAESLLKEEGFTKQKGKWVKPGGAVVQIPIQSMPWDRGAAITSTDQLKNFGIQAEHIAKSGSAGASAFWGTQEYVVTIAESSYPWWGFDTTFSYANGWGNAYSAPDTYEVPWPIGNYESDKTKTIETKKLADQIRTTPLGEDFNQICRKLAWVFNYHLPAIPFHPLKFAHNLNVHGHWKWPEPKPPNKKGRYPIKQKHDQIWGVPQTSRKMMQGVPVDGAIQAKSPADDLS